MYGWVKVRESERERERDTISLTFLYFERGVSHHLSRTHVSPIGSKKGDYPYFKSYVEL